MIDALSFEFMRNALLAGLIASIICGVVGSLVVVNRLVFLSGGIAHSAYGGIGLAFFFGWPFMPCTIIFAVAVALIMATVSLKMKDRADTVIGVMWAVGMAVGILLLDLTPGYNVDLMSYLFGSILSVPRSELAVMALLGGGVIAMVVFFYQDLLLMSYDEEFAQVRGVPVRALYYLLIAGVAVTVVIVVQVVGLILVIALMTIPPSIAEKYTASLRRMMLVSCLLGMIFITGGLWLAYLWDVTSGAAIIMVAAIGFCCSLLADRIIAVRRRRSWLQAHHQPNDPS